MKLSNFTYELPEKLLAEYPSDQRDESRLMVLHRDSNKIEHKLFKEKHFPEKRLRDSRFYDRFWTEVGLEWGRRREAVGR